MITVRSRRRRGVTLIELSLAIGLGMTLAAMLLALFNQQIMFLKIFRSQSFIAEEAPLISLYVGRITGKAERFRLHASIQEALTGTTFAGTNARLTASPVLLMNFRQPDGKIRAAVMAFETRNGQKALNYYIIPENRGALLGDPQWSITKRAKDVSFTIEEGVLRMKITGPADEEITYSGTMQQ